MTIQFLVQKDGYAVGTRVTLDASREAAYIAGGFAKASTNVLEAVDPNNFNHTGGGIGGATVGRIPYPLAQSAIPMVLPSSGSVGNNGALTLTTAIPLSGGYSWGCFMYFPANAIFTGSVAGFYFVLMNANNSGTIYNNTYTSGTPTVPDTPVPFVTTGPGAYTQVLSVVDMLTVTVPANSMGRNGRLQHEVAYVFPNNANNKNCSTAFGGANVYAKTRTTATQETPLIDIRNRGVANRQFSAWANTGGPATSSTSGVLNLAIDTTADVSLVTRCQLSVATDYMIVESQSVQIVPFP